MVDLTQLAYAIITLCTTLITVYLIPLLKKRATAKQFEEVQKWTKIAVEAAEKIYNESGMGEQKKAYVRNFLGKHGFILDDTEIDIMIESAVLEMQNALATA